MGGVHCEGFSWAGASPIAGLVAANQLTYWLQRYDFPQAGGGASLPPLGRFAGSNCLQMGGGVFYQECVLPEGDITTGHCSFHLAISSILWLDKDNPFFVIKESTAHNQFQIGIVGGKLCLMDDVGNILATGTTVLQNAPAYYSISVVMDIKLAGGKVDLYLADTSVSVPEVTFSGKTQYAPTNTVHSFAFGSPGSVLYRYCDWIVYDTLTILSPSRVLTFLPSGDGALSQWTPSAGVTHFNLVNSSPPSGDTAYVEDSTPGDIDLYAYPAMSYNPATIYFVQVGIYARKTDLGIRTMATMVRSGGANFTGVTQTGLNTSFLDIYLQLYLTDPNTGLAWVKATVDGAQFGQKLVA